MKIVTNAEELLEAIGAEPGDTIEIVTPQFTRPAHWPVPGSPPATRNQWEALRDMPRAALAEMGLGNWDGRLMLFPGEWYNKIPAGFEVVSISGKRQSFMQGITDNDIRYGCLAYGVLAAESEDVQ